VDRGAGVGHAPGPVPLGVALMHQLRDFLTRWRNTMSSCSFLTREEARDLSAAGTVGTLEERRQLVEAGERLLAQCYGNFPEATAKADIAERIGAWR
jgi:hypothetical protein